MPSYLVECFNCLSEYDAFEAIWCSCNPQNPTKVCPFCLGCFCAADESFKSRFWDGSPEQLAEEVRTLSQSRMPIGEMLVQQGLITTSQLLDALNRQKVDGRRLGEILVDGGALDAERLETFLRTQHTSMPVDLSRTRVDAVLLARLGVERCIEERILPLESEAFQDRQIMTLAMANPSDTGIVERVMEATGCQVIAGVASAEEIVGVIRSIFPEGAAVPSTLAGASPAPADDALGRVVAVAVRSRASHIRFHRDHSRSRLAFRIDGSPYVDRGRPEGELLETMEAFRSAAGLESAADQPACGSGTVLLDGVEYPIVVRSLPNPEGEDMIVKVIDPLRFPPRLEELAFPPEVEQALRSTLTRDTGLIVVSAPPLSGASSTIYSLLLELIAHGRSVSIVESTRGVTLAGATHVIPEPGGPDGYQAALRAAVGAPPAVVAFPSPSDQEWMTLDPDLPQRHLVVCRMEASRPGEALVEMMALGYGPGVLASRHTLLHHQRLVRRVCMSCRTPYSPPPETVKALGLPPQDAARLRFWHGAGCRDCELTPGFRGCVPLARSFSPDEAVARALAGTSMEEVAARCRAAGLASLRSVALQALEAGHTTPEEILGRAKHAAGQKH